MKLYRYSWKSNVYNILNNNIEFSTQDQLIKTMQIIIRMIIKSPPIAIHHNTTYKTVLLSITPSSKIANDITKIQQFSVAQRVAAVDYGLGVVGSILALASYPCGIQRISDQNHWPIFYTISIIHGSK